MRLLSLVFDRAAVSAGGDGAEALKLSGGLGSEGDYGVVPGGGETL